MDCFFLCSGWLNSLQLITPSTIVEPLPLEYDTEELEPVLWFLKDKTFEYGRSFAYIRATDSGFHPIFMYQMFQFHEN